MSVFYQKTYFRKLLFFSLLMIAVLGLSACQGANPPKSVAAAPVSTVAPAETAAPAETVAPAVQSSGAEPSITVFDNPSLGKILVGDKGMTLYMFTKDTPDTSNCNPECLKKWPPLLTDGHPRLGDGVDASLIGSTTLADGSKIVTYNHMPLYYFYKDLKAGDTNGQDVASTWYVVSPTGEAIKTKN
jgi:predicted lipoprotein with Yx(FWY)xxD motif